MKKNIILLMLLVLGVMLAGCGKKKATDITIAEVTHSVVYVY